MDGARKVKHGLSSSIVRQLCAVFERYSDIRAVYLFGSRAKGNFRDGSDIDLAVVAPEMTAETFNTLWDEIDDLPIVFKLDCLHFESLSNDLLKKKIEAEGVLFYDSVKNTM